MPAGLAALAACTDATPVQVSDSGFGAYEVSLAARPRGAAVAWYDTRDGNAEIYLRLLDAQGQRAGVEHRLTHDPEQSYEADIDAAGDTLAVAWYDEDEKGKLQARLALWTEARGMEWRADLSAPRASRNPVVRIFAERIFCAWIEQDTDGGESVQGGWWSLDGSVLQAPLELGPAGQTTWNLNAAVDALDRAYVVFDAAVETSTEELYLARLDGTERSLARLTRDDGHPSKYPDLALWRDRAALTWFDERDGNREVYLFAGGIDRLADAEPRARRVTDTAGESIGAYLAWNDGRIGLAWSDETRGRHDVYFQTYDAAGSPLVEIERLTRTPTRSLIPAIRAWHDGFAIAWSEVSPGSQGMHDPATRSEISFAFLR